MTTNADLPAPEKTILLVQSEDLIRLLGYRNFPIQGQMSRITTSLSFHADAEAAGEAVRKKLAHPVALSQSRSTQSLLLGDPSPMGFQDLWPSPRRLNYCRMRCQANLFSRTCAKV